VSIQLGLLRKRWKR